LALWNLMTQGEVEFCVRFPVHGNLKNWWRWVWQERASCPDSRRSRVRFPVQSHLSQLSCYKFNFYNYY